MRCNINEYCRIKGKTEVIEVSEYICKIATLEEMEQKWNYLIEIHPNNNAWKIYKEEDIKNMKEKNTKVYYGVLNGTIISEATAFISNTDDTNELVNEHTSYLSAFRTRKEYQGKEYFSKLYNFMENDLKNRGYTKLVVRSRTM